MPERNQWPELWRKLEQAETQHLSYTQMEAYVDSRLEATEAELVRAHTELCGRCAADLNDLKSFARGLNVKEVAQPARLGAWERAAAWFKMPRHSLAVAGAMAVLVVIVVVPHSDRTSAPPENRAAEFASKHPVEAVLEPDKAPRGETFQEQGVLYRVLTQDEFDAYQRQLAAAPDDPAGRGAIDLKFALFGEAEKEYRKLEARGGPDAEKGRQLLQELDQLRKR